MRFALLVALLVASTTLIAGCSSKGEDDKPLPAYTCPDGSILSPEKQETFPDHHNATYSALAHCPKKSSTNSTTLAPNKLPILKLKVGNGTNTTNVTMLNGNLTFDATGSSDPDGSVTGIAVSVTDSNTTRTAPLYDAATKKFKPATFKFDRPGVVNVTVAMVDDRAGFTVNQTHVYVDTIQFPTPNTIAIPGGMESNQVNPCTGATPLGKQDLLDQNYHKLYTFALVKGATFVEATSVVTGQGVADGTAFLTICDPAGAAVSPTGEDATVSDHPLPPPVGIESYGVGATLSLGSEPNATVAVTVVVHYEPKKA